MQRIIYFLNRNKELILFLSLLFFCFYLNISYNQYNKSKFINSSNSFFSFFFETKRNISKYFDLEYQNKILVNENSKLKKQLFNNSNEKIVITGFRDSDLEKAIKSVGGEMSSSVSKKTFKVIVKNMDEDSGKADLGRKYGVLITKDKFISDYLS